MRTVIILALLLLTQAYAAEPYPEHAGAKYPVEHWRNSWSSVTVMPSARGT